MIFESIFSADRAYRYQWKHTWDARPPLVIIGLNPSTADENRRDPTVTRCINFATAWGHGSLWMINLFAFRATDPRAMKEAPDPIGPDNGEWILHSCAEAAHFRSGRVLAAWGNHGTHRNRSRDVLQLLRQNARVPVWALRVTKAGQPQHPLYLPANLEPFEWQPQE